MAENAILKLILWTACTPLVIASRLLEAAGSKRMMLDLEACIVAIDAALLIPDRYIDALILAEDHRNKLHPGIDPIAMIRAAIVRFRHFRLEGASTIEQQFVRVVTNRYEKSLRRKLREQVLALTIVRHRSKRKIAAAYLSNAYFGTDHCGLHALAANCKESLELADAEFILGAISRLKYPEPSLSTDSWRSRIAIRCAYIRQRAGKKANNALQSDQVNLSWLVR